MSFVADQDAAVTPVASSTSAVPLFAANARAKGRTIYNDSSAILYVAFTTGASSTNYTVQLAAGAYYEFPQPVYAGAVTGAWATANGNARTTEW